MKKISIFILANLTAINFIFSQSSGLGINTSGAAADKSAILDVSATDRGLLIPRMTTANRPANAIESLLIYNTTTQCFEAYNEATSQWEQIACLGGCGVPFTDVRDGKSYSTVQIGTQCWMGENLNYGTYVLLSSGGQAGTGTQKYCQNAGGSNDATCPYGGLYEWDEMMGGFQSCNGTGAVQPGCATPAQGICPAGWHIPSHYEWTLLELSLCTSASCATDFPYDITTTLVRGTNEGGMLKQAGFTNWLSPNEGATNSSGFTALPGGNSWSSSFQAAGYYTIWWSATEYDSMYAWCEGLDRLSAGMIRNVLDKPFGFSVRCLKDK